MGISACQLTPCLFGSNKMKLKEPERQVGSSLIQLYVGPFFLLLQNSIKIRSEQKTRPESIHARRPNTVKQSKSNNFIYKNHLSKVDLNNVPTLQHAENIFCEQRKCEASDNIVKKENARSATHQPTGWRREQCRNNNKQILVFCLLDLEQHRDDMSPIGQVSTKRTLSILVDETE